MQRRNLYVVALAAAGMLAAAVPASAQSELGQAQGKAVVTILPAHQGQAQGSISANQLALKVNGKQTNIANFRPLNDANARIELVVMIDGAARSNLGLQINDVAHFIQTLPPGARVAVAYMENGRAAMAGPLSTNRQAAVHELRLPTGPAGISASPYFCLSDLAQHWPSRDRDARRIVVMVTDGVDDYEVRYDAEDPYVQAAISDAVRSRIVVYSIYWRNRGFIDRTGYGADDGQNLLAELTQATGGNSYWMGFGDPVSFQPYFQDIDRRLHNQYEIGFDANPSGKPGVESMKLRLNNSSAKLVAPQQVYVGRPAPMDGE